MAIYDADDNILMRFTYADSRLPVAMQSGGATYYLSYDQVGLLRLVTDASGIVIKTLDYDSFGNIIQDTNPLFDMPLGYSGGLYDPDTDLVRFGFREYSPEIGRWTAKDPILFLGGSSDLYGYCLDDPINWIDPYGLYSFDEGLQDASNLFAGFGDTLTFGGTAWFRKQWNKAAGLSDVVDPCSGWFKGGKWGAYAWAAITAGAFASELGVSAFAHGGANWHAGLELTGNLNLIHLGNAAGRGIHVAVGYVGPFAGWFHLYVWPKLYIYIHR